MKSRENRNGRAEKLFKSSLIAACALSLMLLLSACDDEPAKPTPTPVPTPVVTEPVTPEEPAAFETAVRFIVASDVHIRDSGSDQEEARLAKLFQVGYDYSAAQTDHNTLDGVFFAGDCANKGSLTMMQKFFSIVNDNARSETTVRAVAGNHEFFNSSTTLSDWKQASGYKDVDHHVEINGFHFILLTPQKNGNGYTDEQVSWLDKQIQAARKTDPTQSRPIFVIQHHAPSNTAYGTEKWGSTDLSAVLMKYPQVVDFGGHSHFPINDPRSLWQGDCTVLNTGGLSYFEMGIAGVKLDGVFPLGAEGDYTSSATARDEAQFWIVEAAEDGRMRVQGYDMLSDSVVVSYDLGPFNSKDNFQYTPEKMLANAETPYFTEDAAITPTLINDAEANFRFTQARCRDTVQHYRCELYKDGECIKTELRLSNSWCFPTPETLTVSFDELAPKTAYTLKITAVSALSKESEPFAMEFVTSEEGTQTIVTGEKIFAFGFDESGNAIDSVSGSLLTPCGHPVAAFNEDFGRMGASVNGRSCYRFDDYAKHYDELKKSVSFEFFGKLDVFAPNGAAYSDLLSNQQSGGCGIEITKDGYAQFYVMVNGTYYYPQSKINTGEYVHIVGTFNGKVIKLYVNGELKDSVSVKGSMTVPLAAQFLVVGADSDSGNTVECFMKGEILAANVYSYALSDAEIASNFAVFAE